ncbi:MAG TPA: hypothetical protein ENI87_02905 [bacterium]|nr:hypothetical protein [bacterium]
MMAKHLRWIPLLLPLSFMACVGQTYHVEVGPTFARARGVVALANSSGFLPVANSLEDDMGLGESEAAPRIAASTRFGDHHVRLSGFYIDTEGSGALNQDYGNILAGTQVQNTLDFFAIAGSYSYELEREENYRLAVGAKLAYYSLDVTARSPGGREQVETDALVPMPYIEGEYYWEDLTIGANFGVMSADLGDATGRYWDGEAFARYAIDDRYDVRVGYRYLLLDGYGRASSRDFDADLTVQGVYLSAGVRF